MRKSHAIPLIVILILSSSLFEGYSSNFAKGVSTNALEKWSLTTGEPAVYSVTTEDGYVFATAGYSGSGFRTLYCLDGETGEQLWNRSGNFLAYRVINNRIYITQTALTGAYSQGGLYCLNIPNGAELWKNNLTGYVGEPIIVGTSVYVSAYTSKYSTGVSTGGFYAFDALTGQEKVRYTALSGTLYITPVVQDGYAYLISNSYWDSNNSYTSAVYTLDISSGRNVWVFSSSGYFNTLRVTDGKVIISQNAEARMDIGPANLLALDSQNGTLLWHYLTPQAISDVSVLDNVVYCVTNLGNISAVDMETGQGIWNTADYSQTGSLFFVDDYLYASTITGVSCFNPNDGSKIWSYQAGDYDVFNDLSPTKPLFFNGTVWFGWNGPQGFMAKLSHNFYALNAQTGSLLGTYNFSYSVQATPAISNNTVFIGGSGVTTRSTTWVGPGTVVAITLNPDLTPASSSNNLLVAMGILIVAVTVTISGFLILKKRRRIRNV